MLGISPPHPQFTPYSTTTTSHIISFTPIPNKFRNNWIIHIPLIYLTDKHSDTRELDMTFEEWHQAWRRLLPLIKEFLPDDYNAWNTHFLTIRDKETLTDCWCLWLVYDTEIHCQSVHEGIDIAVHHILVWNDLRSGTWRTRLHINFTVNLRIFESDLTSH